MKKFKETLVFKILQKVAPAIPFGIGSVAENILNDNSTPAGEIDNNELPAQLIKIGIYVVLVYLVLSGKIDWLEAERVKEFIQ